MVATVEYHVVPSFDKSKNKAESMRRCPSDLEGLRIFYFPNLYCLYYSPDNMASLCCYSKL